MALPEVAALVGAGREAQIDEQGVGHVASALIACSRTQDEQLAVALAEALVRCHGVAGLAAIRFRLERPCHGDGVQRQLR